MSKLIVSTGLEESVEQECEYERGVVFPQIVPEEWQHVLRGGRQRHDVTVANVTVRAAVPHPRAAARDWWIQTGQSDVPLE